MTVFTKIFLVMTGGSVGALCRYGFALGAARLLGSRFPWGTLLANMTGCFLIGVAFALSDRTTILSPPARLFFMTGFLGALTTFSTYALESVNYMRSGSHVAVINFLINNLGGGALVLTGFWVVQLLLKGGK
ncbi:fluoride efflux transporter CrcB [Desulfonema ishimotonii]|uniref:Fluoride-specific ion channel FluC n=1 Tax=Desulfonema ishimotonii TaxID=45657 RepID=A0A401FYH0_9BACT|nr:CrcB family protein [Desulfonema ishimotonii]GBC62052.1 fluoride efflux transporter CrcB [Desulfonema ishimotonii]